MSRHAQLLSSPHQRALTAAGINDPKLRQAYERCRLVNADHGKTYYLAALLLPPERRPHVYALYAFARVADEFVDNLAAPDPQGLLTWGTAALHDLRAGHSDRDPIVAATAATVRKFSLDVKLFEDFLAAMRQDITVTHYQTFEDLRGYMWGSAAVIGLMMLPLLGPITPTAADHALALGEGFQLANFIRDIGEDLQRGRVYLPQEDLLRFGVTQGHLESGVMSDDIRELLRFEISRTRSIFEFAAAGIPQVEPQSRPCLNSALKLYGGILDEVERADYDILRRRVSVPAHRRASVTVMGLGRAAAARREAARWQH